MVHRYNSRLNVCDDVDECAEETDDCDPALGEACYNTIGDYICQEVEVEGGGAGGQGMGVDKNFVCERPS